MEAVGKSIRGPQRMLVSHGSLKLVDGDEGNGFLKIDSIQLNWNSERPGNEVENLVNWIDQLNWPITVSLPR